MPIAVAAVALVVGVASAGLAYAINDSDEEKRAGGPQTLGSPESRFPGDLDDAAVSFASSWDRSPALWLGEEFAGYRLVSAMEVVYILPEEITGGEPLEVFLLNMVYGDCEPDEGGEGPSCVPPVAVQVRTPGAIPDPEDALGAARSDVPYKIRGVDAVEFELSLSLWLADRTTVTVHADRALLAEAVSALRSVNHVSLGLREVRPGDDLADFGR